MSFVIFLLIIVYKIGGKLEDDHPYLKDTYHRASVVRDIKDFVTTNLGLEVSQIRTGHLFYGQRAFPFGMNNTEFDSIEKIRFYPPTATSELKPGLILLVDETAHSFDIGIADLGSNSIGIFFEPILVNIVIPKQSIPANRFHEASYYLEIFEIESFGTMKKLRLTDIDHVRDMASDVILSILLFNLECVSRL